MRRSLAGILLLIFLAALFSGCQESTNATVPAPAAVDPVITTTPSPIPVATIPPMPEVMYRDAAQALVDPIFLGQAPMIRMVEQITNRVAVSGFRPGTSSYSGELSASEPVYWRWGVAFNKTGSPNFDMDRLKGAFQYIQVAFFLDGYAIPLEGILVNDYDNPSAFGRDYIVILDDWPSGQHRLQLVVVVTQPVELDGQAWQPGTMAVEDDIHVP